MDLEIIDSLQRLAVAILIGMLIGIDRERTEVPGQWRFAGVRTFPLIALIGALSMLMLPTVGPFLLIATFFAVGVVAAVAYIRSTARGEVGATTEIAALATYLLGALAGMGQLVVAGAAAVAVAVLLVAKVRLERFSKALGPEEVVAALELAVISIIVLPLLPRRGFGPWEVFNPFETWLVVVFVSALSFVGFVAMRLVGASRGLAVMGVVGGLVSSTAMTLSMAERSREDAAHARQAAGAAVLASTIMCARIAFVAGVVSVAILPSLLPALAVMAAVGVGFAFALVRSGRPTKSSTAKASRLGNPFSLRRAITFAVIYTAVKFAVRAAQENLGSAGLYATAAVAGCADVDAPTIAFARLGPLADGWRTPATAVTIAAITNSLVKAGLAVVLGKGEFRRHVAVALAAMGLVGGVVAAVMHWS